MFFFISVGEVPLKSGCKLPTKVHSCLTVASLMEILYRSIGAIHIPFAKRICWFRDAITALQGRMAEERFG
jgi:hypothetical protein